MQQQLPPQQALHEGALARLRELHAENQVTMNLFHTNVQIRVDMGMGMGMSDDRASRSCKYRAAIRSVHGHADTIL